MGPTRADHAAGLPRSAIGLLLVGLTLNALAGCGSEPPEPRRPATQPAASPLADVVARLASSDPGEVRAARQQLSSRPAEALPALEAALRGPDVAVRLGVVEVLADFEEPGIALLLRAALDPDAQVRARSIYRLGVMQADAGREVVEDALGDPEPLVATAAAIACARLCQTPYGLRRLGALAIRHPDMPVVRAVQSLVWREGEVGDLAREAIGDVGSETLALPDADPAQRSAAALIAATAGREEAVPTAAAALSAEAVPERRLALMLALASIDDAVAAAPVILALEGADAEERVLACRGVQNLAARAQAAKDVSAHCQSVLADSSTP